MIRYKKKSFIFKFKHGDTLAIDN